VLDTPAFQIVGLCKRPNVTEFLPVSCEGGGVGRGESRRGSISEAKPARLRFTLICRDVGLETAFVLDPNAQGKVLSYSDLRK
jgi:hypothetical protein